MFAKTMMTGGDGLFVFAVVLLLASASASASAPLTEQLESFSLDENTEIGRTFVTVNGSNIITTPNFVVGITLIGISLALLFGSAASAASVAAASTLAAGSPGKYKRSLPDFEPSIDVGGPASALFKTIATTAEQTLRNFDVTDVDCRKRIICEIHQETRTTSSDDGIGIASLRGGLGSLADVVLDTVNNLDAIGKGKYPFLKQYVEAARNGKSPKECSQVYNTCQYSVKNVLRNLSL